MKDIKPCDQEIDSSATSCLRLKDEINLIKAQNRKFSTAISTEYFTNVKASQFSGLILGIHEKYSVVRLLDDHLGRIPLAALGDDDHREDAPHFSFISKDQIMK